MKIIEFFFHKDLKSYINQERLDLVLIYLAFDQEVVLNISNTNEDTFKQEIRESELANYFEDENLKIYLRKQTESMCEPKLRIECGY